MGPWKEGRGGGGGRAGAGVLYRRRRTGVGALYLGKTLPSHNFVRDRQRSPPNVPIMSSFTPEMIPTNGSKKSVGTCILSNCVLNSFHVLDNS